MRKDKVPTILSIIAFIFLAVLLFSHQYERRQLSAEIHALDLSQREINVLNDELNRRMAEDCKIERTFYGFRCTEFKTGKVYRVYL